jgi:membrane fusion protein (multidrug efflux system)
MKKKPYLIAGIGVVAVVLVLALVKFAQIGKLMAFGAEMQAAGPPPEAVGMFKVVEQDQVETLSAVGSIAAVRGVAVASETAGTVKRIAFESGQIVKAGAVLVELDSAVERAQLHGAEARKELAAANLERTRKLVEGSAGTRMQLENDESALRSAAAEIETIKAQIALKTIRAPFAGKLGIRQVSLGQYLERGTTVVVLESLGDLFVDFSLPQQLLRDVAVGMAVHITLSGVGGEPMTGTISAVDPTVDPVTRTVKIRATLPKESERLRSGMFVNVSVVRPNTKRVLRVPVNAVVRATYGDSVFVVDNPKPDEKGTATAPNGKPVKRARQHFVKLGTTTGDFVEVIEGLKSGQEIVSAGAFKLRNNAPIFQGDDKGPKPELSPQPENR